MEHIVNEQETQKRINASANWHARHKQENNRTIQRYESLSYFERGEILHWLKQNITSIPILAKTKNTGLAELIRENYQSPSASLLVRQAMKALKIKY